MAHNAWNFLAGTDCPSKVNEGNDSSCEILRAMGFRTPLQCYCLRPSLPFWSCGKGGQRLLRIFMSHSAGSRRFANAHRICNMGGRVEAVFLWASPHVGEREEWGMQFKRASAPSKRHICNGSKTQKHTFSFYELGKRH